MQKVEGSNPFIRSSLTQLRFSQKVETLFFCFSGRRGRVAEARVCKTRYTGSIPVGASQLGGARPPRIPTFVLDSA